MSRSIRIHIVLMLLIAGSATFAYIAKPRELMANVTPRAKLTDEVPTTFDNWKKLPIETITVVDPTQQKVLNYLYTETISATYVNEQKQSVMLSIAYGRNQSDGHDVHKPDLCYPAQGFTVLEARQIPIALSKNKIIIAKYMLTQNGQRTEPLLFWTTAGDYVYTSKLQKKIIGFKYSADNLIPDGMVLRVSMIEKDQSIAINALSQFVENWYESLPLKEKNRYFGSDK